jgi:hypothetical protein
VLGLAEPRPAGAVEPPHGCAAALALRGDGVAGGSKSAALSSVSTQPPSLRKSASVALIVGVAALPSKKLALVPKPTRSTI